ncbi:hypothetical protein ACFJIW_16005 [Tahibacter sp. UC22_41]|uniref:hypothetical protein n=1 Tax=Tahibacter sp. UC22_41 TaxID=3350178 RepID=UPI0036D7E7D9
MRRATRSRHRSTTPKNTHRPQGWHALLHLDLCCGTAALTSVVPTLIAPMALNADLPYRPRAFAPPPATDPLRPPIRA